MLNLFSVFSKKQSSTELTLLMWLRTGALVTLVAACILAEFFAFKHTSTLINWPLLSLAVIGSALANALNFFARHGAFAQQHIFASLLADTLLWFMAITATGGAVNPAVSYALVLLCVAAFALPIWQALLVLLLMALCYGLLMQFSPHYHHAMMMQWHLWGMWVLFVLTAIILLWVVALLMAVIRKQDKALAEFREQTVRDEKLLALGTMAGTIAHEIGTPLGTIAMELEDQQDAQSLLIQTQIARCQNSLKKLRDADWQNLTAMPSDTLLHNLQQELLLIRPQANITFEHPDTPKIIHVNAMLQHALLALINNAIDAANSHVNVQLCFAEQLQIDICHDGDAIANDLISKLGHKIIRSNKQHGLGMGYYLANASIEQLAGKVKIFNQDNAVVTRVELPYER